MKPEPCPLPVVDRFLNDLELGAAIVAGLFVLAFNFITGKGRK